MNFELTDEQQSIQAAIQKICQQFDDAYWLARDTDGTFPEDFVKAITEGGWLGIAMPEAYGGAGLGVTETAIMAHAIARSGAGMSGATLGKNLTQKHSLNLWKTKAEKVEVFFTRPASRFLRSTENSLILKRTSMMRNRSKHYLK